MVFASKGAQRSSTSQFTTVSMEEALATDHRDKMSNYDPEDGDVPFIEDMSDSNFDDIFSEEDFDEDDDE